MAGALTASIASIFSGSAVSTDPYFNLTTLLLSTTATNGQQNNTFQDSSTNNFTITRNPATGPNAPTQGTFSPFSQTGWGNYFSGGANYLNVAAASSIDLASSDFTIECWAYPGTQTNAVDAVFGYGGFTTMLYRNGTTWSWEVGNGSSANYFTITATVTPNAWQHIALTRSGNTFTFWINGALANTNSTANAVGTASKNLTIGYNNNPPNAQYFTGYISNFRIVKGTAVYTSAFTPPTAPLTAISNTSLLTCQSNRFIDTNTQLTAKTITLTGSPSVVPFSPFNPTSAWSASTVGGSGYFDGTGDYLSVADNTNLRFGTNAFTIQAWVYRNAAGATHSIIAKGGASTGYVLQVTSTNVLRFTHGTTNVDTTTTTIPAFAWTHVAAVRTNTSTNGFQLYINGVSSATATVATDFNQTDTLYIGSDRSAANVMNGYISGLKYTNGTAESISVPTGPPTATTNVALLTNFTNSGIYDATAKNVLETVGNAQVSTTQSKWSPTSMYFDGTGDYLTSLNSTLYQFGTGDFAIEGWIYINSLSAAIALIDFRATNGATYGQIYITTGGVLRFYLPTDIGTSNSFSTGAWTFFAIARTAGTLNMYIGANRGYTGTYTSAMDGGALKIGADVNGGNGLNGYLQDLRFTKGYGRGYTGATITVPTAAFPVQ